MEKKYNLLLVDDEENILSALQRVFRNSEMFEIITANNAQDALKKTETIPVDVVISDQRMPGMRGAELLQEIKKRNPDSIRFLLSGYADIEAIISAINDGDIYQFIKKPWDNESLKNIVKQSIDQRTVSRIISEAIFRTKRIIDVGRDIKVVTSGDKKSITVDLDNPSKIVSTENILRLINFIIGVVQAEGNPGSEDLKAIAGNMDNKGGKLVLSIDFAKKITFNLELPSSR